ncbi:hypothetical protein [Pedobacter sp. N23S346]|uniref:hypothetical protein n=1 Tax=Pedobacter sp. N23S346 TaxID=3402750 RepID=UPI003AD387F6
MILQDLEEYNNFVSEKLATILNVGKIQSSFVIDEIKHATILPIRHPNKTGQKRFSILPRNTNNCIQ